MTSSKREQPDGSTPDPDASARGKRPYEKPRLVDYGLVTKLTQTGGITTRDTGSMRRQGL